MKKKDIILVLFVILAIVFTFGINYFINIKSGENIQIYVNNKLYRTYNIDDKEDVKIENEYGYNIIKIHGHGVEITEASCHDKVCVNSGFITNPSQSIVCLPNKVNIKITTNNDNYDNEEDIISN